MEKLNYTKKGGIVVLIIIVLIIITSYLFRFVLTENKTLEEKIIYCSKDIDCITKIAIENLNEEICNEIGVKYDVTQCSVEVTIAKGNITECGKYRLEQEYCENQILGKSTNKK
ncbi:MAG: hypothetical protein KKF67_00520 [Nanoarchaeota archaeon]|nr:hypothetical protein [Nanoarchaeota archaeon]